jgi:hypothetical protein
LASLLPQNTTSSQSSVRLSELTNFFAWGT